MGVNAFFSRIILEIRQETRGLVRSHEHSYEIAFLVLFKFKLRLKHSSDCVCDRNDGSNNIAIKFEAR